MEENMTVSLENSYKHVMNYSENEDIIDAEIRKLISRFQKIQKSRDSKFDFVELDINVPGAALSINVAGKENVQIKLKNQKAFDKIVEKINQTNLFFCFLKLKGKVIEPTKKNGGVSYCFSILLDTKVCVE